MDVELQEFILNMTPNPNAEGHWLDSGVLRNTHRVIVPLLELVFDIKF